MTAATHDQEAAADNRRAEVRSRSSTRGSLALGFGRLDLCQEFRHRLHVLVMT
jgi:hypothetical protein